MVDLGAGCATLRRAHPRGGAGRLVARLPGVAHGHEPRRPARRPLAAIEEAGGPRDPGADAGRSVPIYLFTETLQVPVIGVPTVNHDNSQHSANENLPAAEPVGGDRGLRVLIARLGELWK